MAGERLSCERRREVIERRAGDRKMTQTRFPFELDGRAEPAALTGHCGVALVIEAFRSSGTTAVVDASVLIKRRKRGLTES